MSSETLTGIFGKLPAHGDFVHRNLPPDFVNIWDEWLQHYIATSQEQLGESWLNIYLTSPIWRFVMSEGVIDKHSWAGFILPSVDRVGRYFPFSTITQIPSNVNPLEFFSTHTAWFEGAEEVALQALNGDMVIDEYMDEIKSIEPEYHSGYVRGSVPTGNAVITNMEFEEQSATSMFPYMLDSCLLSSVNSYSAWSTAGSEYVEPCFFTTQGLPPLSGIAAMIDGDWLGRNWQQPYILKVL